MLEYLLLISVVPVVLILWYIYKKDSHKEPTKQLVKAFGFGILAFVPILFIELILDIFFPTNLEQVGSALRLLLNVFISIALVEEIFKWLVVRLGNYNNKNFDQSYDAIVYCVFASLGFACIENLLYVLTNTIGEGIISGTVVGVIRGLFSVPSHAFDGVLMGFFMAKAKIAQSQNLVLKERKFLFLSVLVPTIEHTIFDFLLMYGEVYTILLDFAMTLGMYVLCILLIKKTAKNNILISNRDVMANQNLNS